MTAEDMVLKILEYGLAATVCFLMYRITLQAMNNRN